MRDVYDFAKFFIKSGADFTPNTYDGNMKLQNAEASGTGRYGSSGTIWTAAF